MKTSISSSAEHPVNLFPSQAYDVGLMMLAATLRLDIVSFLKSFIRNGSFGKTSLAYCLQMEDGTLVPSLGRWQNSGMGSHGECWTLNSSESRSVVVASSLSDVLETSGVPQRYYLSPIACSGILRRAENRKRQLPPLLRRALERVAQMTTKPRGGHIIPVDATGLAFSNITGEEISVTSSLDTRIKDGPIRNQEAPIIAFSCKDYGADAGDTSPTLRSMNYDGSHLNDGGQVAIVQQNPVFATLPASGAGTARPSMSAAQADFCINGVDHVRRITPTEAERLQGFPDDYTSIIFKKKVAVDSHRYRAIGNSMAIPVMRWIGERIHIVEELYG